MSEDRQNVTGMKIEEDMFRVEYISTYLDMGGAMRPPILFQSKHNKNKFLLFLKMN